MNCNIFNENDFGMIEGSHQILTLNLYDILGNVYKNILIVEAEWRMSKYGEIEVLASKNTTDNPTEISWNDGVIKIIINANDTLGLYGKFTHQVLITDYHGNIFIADLGKISIKPQIKSL